MNPTNLELEASTIFGRGREANSESCQQGLPAVAVISGGSLELANKVSESPGISDQLAQSAVGHRWVSQASQNLTSAHKSGCNNL